MNDKLSKNDLKAINENLKKLSFYDNGNKISDKRYRISEESFITSGGQAYVYRLLDGKRKSPYVLKIYRDRYSERDYIYQKYEEKNSVVQKLKNSNILLPKTRYIFDDRYIVVEDYHRPLEEYEAFFTHNRGRDDVQIAFIAAICLLECFIDLSTESGKLKYAIYHCDVKPDNILMAGEDINEGFLLTDFGVAAYDVGKGGDTLLLGIGGSYTTMSPEIYNHNIENLKKSDMYSIGVTLYYYLAGCYPGGAEKSDDEIHKQRLRNKNFKIERPAKGSEKFKDLVMKAMAYDPKDRFDSYTEMYEELKKCEEYGRYIAQQYGNGKTVFWGAKGTAGKTARSDKKEVKTVEFDDFFQDLFETPEVVSKNANQKDIWSDIEYEKDPSRLSFDYYARSAAESRKKKVANFVVHIDEFETDVSSNRPRTKGEVYFANYRRQKLAEKNESSRHRKNAND